MRSSPLEVPLRNFFQVSTLSRDSHGPSGEGQGEESPVPAMVPGDWKRLRGVVSNFQFRDDQQMGEPGRADPAHPNSRESQSYLPRTTSLRSIRWPWELQGWRRWGRAGSQ